MKIHSLSAYNFMPYRGDLNLVFPQDEQRNVMIVFGDNMRGKTSILNAIRWVFYGEAVGRHSIPISLQDVINWDAAAADDWKVEVHIKFEANGHEYDLRRIAERRSLAAKPTSPDDFSESLHLLRDGAAVSGDKIEAEIGAIAPKQISRFFLFDGELLQEYETLLIEDSQQGQQIKEAIEQVLGVPALTNGRVDIQTILRKAQKQQSSDLKQVKGLEQQAQRQEKLTAEIDALERDVDDLKAKLEKVCKERDALNDELEAQESVIGAKATLDSKIEEQKKLIEECNKKEIERLDLISEAWKDIIDSQLQFRRNQLVTDQGKLVKSLKERSGLEQKVSDLNKLLDTRKCPTCGQRISEDGRSKIGDQLGKAEAKLQSIDDSTKELEVISGQIQSLSKIRGKNAKDQIQQIDNDLQGYNVRLTEVENEIEALNEKIAGYDTAEIARKRVLRNEKIKEEGRLVGEIDVQNVEVRKLKEELAISQKAIEGLTKDRTQRSTIKVSLCSNLETVFHHSIDLHRDQLRSRVEKLANDAFKKMTTQKSYKGLKINENYGLNIIGASGRNVPLRSAGAEQIVALSLIDGLNRTGRSSGPVIMDTPFGRLDLKHRENILKYLPSVTSQFVMLVHSGEIRRETDLAVISERIGAVYDITEISSTHSELERTTL